jgi:putative membrane protein
LQNKGLGAGSRGMKRKQQQLNLRIMKHMGLVYAATLLCSIASCDDDDNSNDKNLAKADERFVEKVALGNMTEVDFGSLASTRGESEMVRMFGSHMVTEHNTAQTELRTLSNDFDNVNWPGQLDPQHQQIRQQLMTLSGYQFDSAYMASQVSDHQMTLTLFENELDSGKDERVRAYANKYKPHIEKHLQKADSIMTVLSAMATGN